MLRSIIARNEGRLHGSLLPRSEQLLPLGEVNLFYESLLKIVSDWLFCWCLFASVHLWVEEDFHLFLFLAEKKAQKKHSLRGKKL